jgi:hypothetical protein
MKLLSVIKNYLSHFHSKPQYLIEIDRGIKKV